MTQAPRYGLNKERRLAAEREENASKEMVPPLDPPFPYTCLPNPFAGMGDVELSLAIDNA